MKPKYNLPDGFIAEIHDIRDDGEAAIVGVMAGEVEYIIRLVRERGDWKLDDLHEIRCFGNDIYSNIPANIIEHLVFAKQLVDQSDLVLS